MLSESSSIALRVLVVSILKIIIIIITIIIIIIPGAITHSGSGPIKRPLVSYPFVEGVESSSSQFKGVMWLARLASMSYLAL